MVNIKSYQLVNMSSVKKVKYLFFFITLKFFAQKPIVTSYEYKLYSKVLSEERTIQVQLPKNYNDSLFAQASYPVMYVLDGDFNFQFITALERFNTKFLYRSQPEMILVGIKNVDRARDFTPSHVQNSKFKRSGGAAYFSKFISDELKPYINKTFRTNGFDILWGHSFSGLFTIYTLLENPDLFNSYIAIDPSLWWDDKLILKKDFKKTQKSNSVNKSLCIAIAGNFEKEQKKMQHTKTIHKFCKKLSQLNETYNLRSNCKKYPEYNHGEVPISGTVDALKFLFEGIELPVKQIPEQPELVKKRYQQLSEKLDFKLYPDESLLVMLINYCLKNNRYKNADRLRSYALKLYPKSKQLQTFNEK